MKYNFFQRRYWDARMGLPLVSPIVNAANFIILSYNFAGISEVMPMELYIPIFVITISAMLAGVGNLFRRKQQQVDWDMTYERMPEQAKTNRLILECLKQMFHSSTELRTILEERCAYLKKIEEGRQPGGSV